MAANDSLHPAEQVAQDGLCVGCGFCVAIDPGLEMVFSAERGRHIPRRKEGASGSSVAFSCPGRFLDMPALLQEKYGGADGYEGGSETIAGPCRRVCVGYSGDAALRRNGASGGMAAALAAELFRRGEIDCAYGARAGESPEHAHGVVIDSPEELARCQGSVYQSVRHGGELGALLRSGRRFAFIGLPCQLAGLEANKKNMPNLTANHIFSIGLICSGVPSAKAWQWLMARHGLEYHSLRRLRRHGPWPSRWAFEASAGGAAGGVAKASGQPLWKKLAHFAAAQGPWCSPRCRMCPDPLADLADITVGDPHFRRYTQREGDGFSLLLCRSAKGSELFSAMEKSGAARTVEEGGAALVLESQKYLLDNRRHAGAWLEAAKRFAMPAPVITPYPAAEFAGSFRHRIWAFAEMGKIARKETYLRLGRLMPFAMGCEMAFLTYLPLWAAPKTMRRLAAKIWGLARRVLPRKLTAGAQLAVKKQRR